MNVSQENFSQDVDVKTLFSQQYSEPQPVPPPPTQLADQSNTINQNENETNQNGKRPGKKFNPRRQKKQKVATFPVYFDDTSIPTKHKFKCTTTIKIKDKETGKINEHNFEGEGLSKKDARKDCANKALTTLYPDSYQLPEKIIEDEAPTEEITDDKIKNLKRIAELRRRISKLVTPKTIIVKAPSQILHELSSKIADTAKCIQENGITLDKKFCYQIDNLQDETIVSLDDNDQNTRNAYGFGKSKKDAKNQAAKYALKQFFNCDLGTISNETSMTQQQQNQSPAQLSQSQNL
ncbi:unnamed protein product [Brachionus calyciflorus]|uniref:DRBM domain-containing protein n=1 Tax=Brachionus calyciflorus TaxID=104777 RepID=A0A813UAY0_9BILA|nr:unnamed protein product [Brachionus calyciflorus]